MLLARDMPGCVLFCDPSVGVTLATGVSQWGDKSGLGHHLLQAVAAKQLAFSATGGPNSRPCLVSDGADDFILASWTQTTPLHSFVVSKWNDVFAAQTSLFDGAVTNSNRLYRFSATGDAFFSGGAQISGSPGGQTTWHIRETQNNGATSAYLEDGATVLSGTVNASSPGGLTLGAIGGGGGDWSNASYAFVAVFNRILSAPESTRFRTLLKLKFNL